MGQLEIFAGPVALDTWGPLLQDTQVIHFVDNDSATSCLVKGYSPKEDSCKLVGDYWLRAAARRMNVYIDRVESKSNIADGPSRWDFKLPEQLGAVFHQPKTDVLLSPPSSDPWFWFGADQQLTRVLAYVGKGPHLEASSDRKFCIRSQGRLGLSASLPKGHVRQGRLCTRASAVRTLPPCAPRVMTA